SQCGALGQFLALRYGKHAEANSPYEALVRYRGISAMRCVGSRLGYRQKQTAVLTARRVDDKLSRSLAAGGVHRCTDLHLRLPPIGVWNGYHARVCKPTCTRIRHER